ncbi:glutaredoxin family protein [Arenicellales bacterium IMCC55707]
MITFILYTRVGCHLCEDMQTHLSSLQNDHPFALEVRDVDRDLDWAEKFDDKVPVLFWGDQEICRYFLDLVKFKDIFLKNNS